MATGTATTTDRPTETETARAMGTARATLIDETPGRGTFLIKWHPPWRQAGYWSWRAHTSIHSPSVSLRPAERISASSVKYSSRGGPGANRMSIRAGAPLSLEKG